MPAEALQPAAATEACPPQSHRAANSQQEVRGAPAGQPFPFDGGPWIAPHRIGLAARDVAATEAALRRHVEQQDIIENRTRLHPPLTTKERVGLGICMAVAALIGAMLAIGGPL